MLTLRQTNISIYCMYSAQRNRKYKRQAAAYTAVDTAESEPELAKAANTVGPENLVTAAARLNIPMVHVSTAVY